MKRGVMQFIPLAIGVAITMVIIVSVVLPLVNRTVYSAPNITTGGAYINPWTGTSATILNNLLPLVAVLALAAIAVVLMTIFRTD